MSNRPPAEYLPVPLSDGVIWRATEQAALPFTGYSYREEGLEKTRGFGLTKRLPFIPWGEDNLFPLRILNLYAPGTGNAAYAAVMRDHAAWIRGKGLVWTGSANDILKGKGLFTERDLYVWAYDLAMFNSFAALEVSERDAVLSVDDGQVSLSEKRLQKVYAVDLASVRIGAPVRDEDGQFMPRYFYYAQDWRQIEINYVNSLAAMLRRGSVTNAYIPELAPVKGLSDQDLDGIWKANAVEGQRRSSHEREEFMLRALHYDVEYHPASYFYPVAAGESALTELEMAPTVAKWFKTSIDNGLAPSAVVKFPKSIARDEQGMVTKEELKAQRAIIDQYTKNSAQSRGAGSPIFLFYDPNVDATPPTIDSQPTDNNDKRWAEVSKEVQQRAFTALGVVQPEIYGIPTPAGFSNKAETLELAFNVTEQRDLGPRRARLEAYLNSVLRQAGNQATVKIERIASPFATTQTTDVQAEKQAELRGSLGGVQGILQTQAGIAAGTTEYDSAVATFEIIYGLPREAAARLAGTRPKTDVSLPQPTTP